MISTPLENLLMSIFDERRTRDRSVTRRQLVQLTGQTDRVIRDTISDLKNKGYAIASLGKGYFWASDPSDIDAYIRREFHRINTIRKTLLALKKIIAPKSGFEQMEIF